MRKILFSLESKKSIKDLEFQVKRMVNAGYVGRNQEEVRKHIKELANKGIPGPENTPTLYPMVTHMLMTESEIEVFGQETSGEVEYVLAIENEETIFVGLGSDQTDRYLEKTDIPRAKQICPNVMSGTVWDLEEIIDHWDDLEIESSVTKQGEEILCQKGRLELIMDPKSLIDFVESKIKGSMDGMIIFSGTLGALTGGMPSGEEFRAKLFDPKLDRELSLRYKIHTIDYLQND